MNALEEKVPPAVDAATQTDDQRILGLLKEVEELRASRDKISRPIGTFSVGYFDDTTLLIDKRVSDINREIEALLYPPRNPTVAKKRKQVKLEGKD